VDPLLVLLSFLFLPAGSAVFVSQLLRLHCCRSVYVYNRIDVITGILGCVAQCGGGSPAFGATYCLYLQCRRLSQVSPILHCITSQKTVIILFIEPPWEPQISCKIVTRLCIRALARPASFSDRQTGRSTADFLIFVLSS
jgi:hypothetical protein